MSEPILGSINLHLADLDDPDHSAPFADLDRLFGLCLRRTKCGHFGLLVGQYIDLRLFGVAGRLARNAPSVGAALQEFAGFLTLHDSGGSLRAAIDKGRGTFGYDIHVPGVAHTDQIYDLAVAAIANVMRKLHRRRGSAAAQIAGRQRRAGRRVTGNVLTRCVARLSRKVARLAALNDAATMPLCDNLDPAAVRPGPTPCFVLTWRLHVSHTH